MAPVPRLTMRAGERPPAIGRRGPDRRRLASCTTRRRSPGTIRPSASSSPTPAPSSPAIVTRNARALAIWPAAGVRARSDHAWGEAPWTIAGRSACPPRCATSRTAAGTSRRPDACFAAPGSRAPGCARASTGSISRGASISATSRRRWATSSRRSRAASTIVRLSDGSAGLLPEEWLAQHRAVGRTRARRSDEGDPLHAEVRRRSSTRWLAAAPEVDVDAQFAHARDELRTFDRVAAVRSAGRVPGRAARVSARRARLAPLPRALRVRRLPRRRHGARARPCRCWRRSPAGAPPTPRRDPSLVVVPRSLVFNWLREAARFAPTLRVLDHTGAGRSRTLSELRRRGSHRHHLRHAAARCAAAARRSEFDYVVLDEAHAIKNVDSQTAKAVRLLRGATAWR